MALLTTAEAAAILKLTPDTVRRLIRRGDLPAYTVGRIKRIDLQQLHKHLNKGTTNHDNYN
jgi:excisionase family DNA binding protein